MRHSQLRAFHHVARLGGFSRAAEALHLTQPAVSEQVRNLEQDHDVLLFRRVRKRVELTDRGAALYDLTKRYFETEAQIGEFLAESRAALDGTLRIIADSAHHVTGILARFRARHPGVTVALRTGNSDEVLTALRNYDAEIGVAGSLAGARDMQKVPLGESRIVAFAARGYLPEGRRSLRLADLAETALVLRERGSRTRAQLEQEAARRRLHLKPAIEAEGRESVRELVASGAGIGFVSQAEFGHDPRLVQIALEDVEIKMSETLLSLQQRRGVRAIRAFMDLAADTPNS